MLRLIASVTAGLLVTPSLASAAADANAPAKEQVTLAMFILIFALIALLAIAVAFENRKGSKH
jgi:hypothetical protein